MGCGGSKSTEVDNNQNGDNNNKQPTLISQPHYTQQSDRYNENKVKEPDSTFERDLSSGTKENIQRDNSPRNAKSTDNEITPRPSIRKKKEIVPDVSIFEKIDQYVSKVIK